MTIRFTLTDADWSGNNSYGSVPIAFRFWRLKILGSGDPAFVSSPEIEMRTSVGGADQTAGKTYFASSEFGVSSLAQYAFNDNPADAWTTASGPTFPVTIGVDFGAGNEKAIVQISWSPRDVVAWSPTGFVVESSIDGVTYHPAWTQSGITGWVYGTPKIFTRPHL